MRNIYSFPKASGIVALLLLLATAIALPGRAQIIFTAAGLTQTENFNGMSGLTLPGGFTMQSSGAATSADASASSLNSTSSGRTYKFISGSDYAIGILNSGSFSSPRNIDLKLENNTGAAITSLTISFNYEKYRTGNRAWNWTFFGGPTTGSMSAQSAGNQSYPIDAAGNGTAYFPPQSVAKTVTITGLNIPQGGFYYLRWTLTGVGGSTNGQALAIDDLSITAAVSLPCAPPSGLAANNITGTTADLSWNSVSGAAGYGYVVDQSAANPAGAGTATTATAYNATGLSGSTTYYLHVRTSCGSGNFSSWATIPFTTLPVCVPPVATITPAGPTAFCPGGNVLLQANTGSGLSYQWQLNGNNISSANASGYTATTAGSYSVIVSSAAGCADTSTATTVVVHAAPIVSITAAGAITFCQGGSVQLDATAGAGWGYQWQANGANISAATAGSYTAAATSSYAVIVTDANGCADTSNSIAVQVNANPVVSAAAAGALSFCSGDSVVINASLATGLSYQWQNGGAPINGATSASYTASASGTFTVAVSDGSCSSVSNPVTVTVHSLPVAVVTPAGPLAFCPGDSVQLSAGTGSGLAYQWLLGGAPVNGAAGSTLATDVPGSYTVKITDGNGCSQTSAPVSVAANTAASVSISPIGPLSICDGGSTMLTASGAATVYTWRKDGALIGGVTGSTCQVTAAGSYTVEVTNASGCDAISAPVLLTVDTTPVVTLAAAGSTTFCAGNMVMLNATNHTGWSYQWQTNGVNVPGTVSDLPASSSGNYTVIVSDGNGCKDTSNNITVTVHANPVVSIAATGSTTFCAGGSVQLEALPASGLSYQWQANGSNVPGTASNLPVSSSGAYAVIVSDGNGCKDTSNNITVTVHANPVVSIAATGPTTFCAGGFVQLEALPASGLSYQWQNASGIISGAVGSTYTANAGGSYSVLVTDNNNCSDTSAVIAIMVNPLPVAVVTAGGPLIFCSGSHVQLNAPAGLSYQWLQGNTVLPGANTASYIAASSGNFAVAVSDGNGCADTSAAVAVAANPSPSALVTAGGPLSFCQDDSVVLHNNSGSGYLYQWQQGGVDIAAATNASYTVLSSGTYRLIVSGGNGCSDTSGTVVVTVHPNPTATVAATGATTVCAGTTVALSATTAGSGLGYQWLRNGSSVPGATSAAYNAASSGMYQVVVSNGFGCVDTASGIPVVVNPVPVAAVTPAGTVSICQGNTVVLSAATGSGLGYQWQLNGANIASATGSSYTASAAGSYSVIITNSSNCKDTSNVVVIATYPPVSATVTPAVPPVICQGDSTLLSAGAGVGWSYQWYLNGVPVPGVSAVSYYAKNAGAYTVVVTGAGGCTAASSAVNVTVNPSPVAQITYSAPLAFCEGSAVVLTATQGSGQSYQWSRNGVAIPGAVNDYYIAAQTGAYTLQTANSFGCTRKSAALNVQVYPKPQPVITGNGFALSTGAYSSYQWLLNGQPISGATGASWQATANGGYSVRVTDGNGCDNTADVYFINTVGIHPVGGAAPAVRIYPNPVAGSLHIEAPASAVVVVQNAAGLTIYKARGASELSMSGLPDGLYLVSVSAADGSWVLREKVIKQAR